MSTTTLEEALSWCRDQWPTIEFSYKACSVVRLEPGQGSERVFTAPTFLEAVEMAIEAPPFTGETHQSSKDERIALLERRIIELEEMYIKARECQGHE